VVQTIKSVKKTRWLLIYFRCIINIFDKIAYCWEHRRTANRSHCTNLQTLAVENRELTIEMRGSEGL